MSPSAPAKRALAITCSLCSSRTRPACSPAWRDCSRVAGYNIFSLAVAPTDDERFSRISIVVDVESAPLEQVVAQLDKLINVVEIGELHPDEAREAELLLVSVAADADQRSQVIQLVGVFAGRIVDVGHEALTVMVAGHAGHARRLREAHDAVRDRRPATDGADRAP